MTVRDTSREAYASVIPRLTERQREVLEVIGCSSTAMTNAEIGRELRLEINQVTGRTNELVKLGLVADFGKRRCTVNTKYRGKVLQWGLSTKKPPARPRIVGWDTSSGVARPIYSD